MEEIKKQIFTHPPSTTAFEPVIDASYSLSYVCLLIPRFQSHMLSGDLVQYLYIWMQQISVSYGWKLEFVDVQPQYMQWLITVPVTTPPSQIMRLVRQHTSQKIFEDFPRFKNQNLAKDFWAPGYLMLVGKQLPSSKMIKEFIQTTRQKQAGGLFPVE